MALFFVVLIGIVGAYKINSFVNELDTESSNVELLRKQKEIQLNALMLYNTEHARFREQYASTIETSFRNNHLKVIASVSGKYNETMTLTCLFFNSNWPAAMEKNGLLTIWKNLGFKKVILSDSMGYSHIFTF
jgi:hypothetical protein